MGRTKALVEIDGVPMAARVAAAMRDAGCTDVVALGGDAVELAPLGLAVVPDRTPGAGPLAAIVTALEWAGDRHEMMVLACDLPYVTAADLARLTAVAADEPGADVIVARTDRPEPACAVWRAQALDRVTALVADGERAVHRALTGLVTVEVAVAPRALRNINTPEDLRGYP
jgi:molybdopterin-guanine dinucleotide biosynthesis protein A